MLGTHAVSRRLLVALLVATVMVVTFAGCGGGSSQTDLVAQDQLVQLGNRLAAAHARLERAQQLVERQRRIAAAIAKKIRQTGTLEAPAARLQPSFGFDLCSGIGRRGRTKAERIALRARERQRQRALYYLNLSCPTVGT